MRKITKRVFTLLLTLVMLSTALPLGVFAMDSTVNETSAPTQATSEVKGTNDAGDIIMAAIDGQSFNGEEQGYGVSEITITGKTADVRYSSPDGAKIVVAIYDESTSQMLGSGITDVDSTANEAEVEINIASMPEYFIVKGFLLDENNANLAKAYVVKTYTKAYEEFDKQTTDDFDSDLVINFDSNKNDNFAVLNEGTVKAESTASKNIVTEDEATDTFVITNADDTVKNLKSGDVLYITFSDKAHDFNIIKVTSVSVDGDTVTIESGEETLADVFSVVKIDSVGGITQESIDNAEYGEALTPMDKEEMLTTQSVDDVVSESIYCGINYNPSEDISITGSLTAKVKAAVRITYDAVLFGEDYFEYHMKTESEFGLIIDVKGKIDFIPEEVKFKYPVPLGPIVIELQAYPIVSVTAKISLVATAKITFNHQYITGYGEYKNTERESKILNADNIKGSVEIRFGMGVAAEITIAKSDLLKVKFELSVGLKFTGKADELVKTMFDDYHDCDICVSGLLSLFAEVKVTVDIKITEKVKWNVLNATAGADKGLGEMYISLINGAFKFGFGKCPNKLHKVTYIITDENGEPIDTAKVSLGCNCYVDLDGDGKISDDEKSVSSLEVDSDGEAVAYYHNGSCFYSVTAPKYSKVQKELTVYDNSCYITVKMKKVKLYAVELSVTDEDGNAISAASVELGDHCYMDVNNNGELDDSDIKVTSLSVDSKGKATVWYLEGDYTFKTSAKGYADKYTDISVTDKDLNVTIKLKPDYLYKVTFYVTSAEDESPIEGAVISLGEGAYLDSNGNGKLDDTDQNITSVTTDSSGSASACYVYGIYNVETSADGYKNDETLIRVDENGESVSITLEKSDVTVGDLITFGSYPQSKVTDSATLSALNSLSLNWVSYGYYSGTGSYGTMTASDYMKYADTTYNGEKYRAVKFTEYRPYYTYYQTNTSGNSTYQDNNGYYTNTTYWFKYDPIYWRVLDPNDGLILCETIVDSQPYSNTIYYANSNYWNNSSYTNYANDYATSSIREWLNDDFYNTAFTSTQKSKIKTTTLDNSAYSDIYSKYDSATTNDKVFLLSWDEVLNTQYGFDSDRTNYDTARRAQGSDYAKCQGLWVNTDSDSAYYGNSDWRLRSPGGYSNDACNVDYAGSVFFSYSVDYAGHGVRPALKISHLESLMSASYGEGEYLETETLEAESAAILQPQTGAEAQSFSYASCVAGGTYTLLNVLNYGEDFELTANNLLYIDVLTADENGSLTATFTPIYNDENSTTLLIGDFGNGIEAKVMSASDHTCAFSTFAYYQTVHPHYAVYKCSCGEEKVTTTASKFESCTECYPVVEKTLVSIAIKTPPTTYEYKYGIANLDTSGLEIVATYSDGSTAVVDNSKVEFTGFDTSERGIKTITATYEGCAATFDIEVYFTFGQWLLYIICFGWIWM